MSKRRILLLMNLLLIAAMACSLPSVLGSPTATPGSEGGPPPTAGPSPTPLPPTPPELIETRPAPGERLAPTDVITLYFDQPMNQPSVETAFAIEPASSGDLRWQDERTLQFQPDQPLPREADYRISIGTEARSAEGLAPNEPLTASFKTAGFAEVTQVQPAPAASGVSPTARLQVAFNQPMVALGVDGNQPQPLRFDPPISGTGEWVGTSLYVFKPEPALPAGTAVTATVESGLTAPDGSLLNSSFTWSFSTTRPQLIESNLKQDQTAVPLDPEISLSFNTPLSAGSFEGSLQLSDAEDQEIPVSIDWNDAGDQALVLPERDLEYETEYRLQFDGATGAAGTPLIGDTDLRFTTVPEPALLGSNPVNGGVKEVSASLRLFFSGPMSEASLLENISVQPEIEGLSISFDEEDYTLFVRGNFQPAQQYTLRLGRAQDAYGTPIDQSTNLTFRTGDLPPRLDFSRFHNVLTFSTSQPPSLRVQATNVSQIDLTLNRLTLDQFALARRQAVDYIFNAQSLGQPVRSWTTTIGDASNRNQTVAIPLTDSGSLSTGVYQIIMDTPEDSQPPRARLLLVRGTELVLKAGGEQLLVWAVDLTSGQPVSEFEAKVLDETSSQARLLAQGVDGFAEFSFNPKVLANRDQVVFIGQPGDSDFGLTQLNWNQGIAPYEFGLPYTSFVEDDKVYLYTDRPLYRPGQTVHYKGIYRKLEPLGYQLPPDGTIGLSIKAPNGSELDTSRLTLSDFGTFSGSFELDEDAPLGLYRISSLRNSVFFEVGAYRKPEFELDVSASHQDRITGQPLTVDIEADYFFGAPVTDQEVSWRVFSSSYRPPDLPAPYPFFISRHFPEPAFGAQILEGSGVTDGQGKLTIEIPTDMEEPESEQWTIEASISEEGELPVSARTTVTIHASEVYLSVVPVEYSLRAGEQAEFRLHAADYLGQAIAGQSTEIEVYRVTWQQIVSDQGQLDWERQESLVNRDQLQTGSDGSVLASFIPQQAGSYEIRASAEDEAGRPAEASTSVWVVGPGGNVWRQRDPNRIELVPDKEEYQPGEVAQVLIPSPFEEEAQALITIERETIIERQVQSIPAEGLLLEVPLTADYPPNVYLSAILIRPATSELPPAAAAGLVNLPVSAEANRLAVQVSADRGQAQPGEEVTYRLEATEADGRPAQAEFSLSLVDEALLALKDPYSDDPFEALFQQRPLGVGSALGLVITGESQLTEEMPLGRGGGGGDFSSNAIRQQFEDTAYWNPSVVTDNQGQAEVTITMPDNLTSWQMEARGVTLDTEVGSDEHSLTVNKPLLIRPVTPRFFTAGDQSTVAAVVHNDTGEKLTVDVRLSANGAAILSAETTTATISNGQSARIEWQLEALDVAGVGLTFFAQGGGYQDASTPTIGTARDGQIPVLRYSAPDTEATAGWLPEPSSRTETVSLPASFDPTQGDLNVSLEPSLGSVVFRSTSVLEDYPYETTGHLAARLMVTAGHLRVTNQFENSGLRSAENLEEDIQQILQKLLTRQNVDGGWGWWSRSASDRQLTAHVLDALTETQRAGVEVDERLIERTGEYLSATLSPPNTLDEIGLNRQAYIAKVLTGAGFDYTATLQSLAAISDRLPLRAKAFLVQALSQAAPADAQMSALAADLESAAMLSATGTHWEPATEDLRYYTSGIETTAQVMRALISVNPESPNLPGATRWLVLNRDGEGGWRTSHNTGWATMALLDWLEATGAGGADYEYSLRLNGDVKAEGSFQQAGISNSTQVSTPINEMNADRPNVLSIERGAGEGTLSYTAHLTVYRPASEVSASSRGLSIERRYYLDDGECDFADNPCQPVQTASVGDNLLVRLTLTVPGEVYFLAAEDRFGAGFEPIDPGLKTSQTRSNASTERYQLSWLGWNFNRVEFDDEKLLLFADYLPAGTYTYTYRLHASFAGEYQTLPARAWLTNFPEVYGQSAGMIFPIRP